MALYIVQATEAASTGNVIENDFSNMVTIKQELNKNGSDQTRTTEHQRTSMRKDASDQWIKVHSVE